MLYRSFLGYTAFFFKDKPYVLNPQCITSSKNRRSIMWIMDVLEDDNDSSLPLRCYYFNAVSSFLLHAPGIMT